MKPLTFQLVSPALVDTDDVWRSPALVMRYSRICLGQLFVNPCVGRIAVGCLFLQWLGFFRRNRHTRVGDLLVKLFLHPGPVPGWYLVQQLGALSSRVSNALFNLLQHGAVIGSRICVVSRSGCSGLLLQFWIFCSVAAISARACSSEALKSLSFANVMSAKPGSHAACVPSKTFSIALPLDPSRVL